MENNKLFIEGQWVNRGAPLEIANKYTGQAIGTLPIATQVFGATSRLSYGKTLLVAGVRDGWI